MAIFDPSGENTRSVNQSPSGPTTVFPAVSPSLTMWRMLPDEVQANCDELDATEPYDP
jgi:hypothetical protein